MNELRTMNHQVNTFTPDQVELLKSQIARGASDDELKLFIQVCQRTGLDPFARQIYAVIRNDKNSSTGKRMVIQTSIDGFRLIAQRSHEYAGQAGPEWCGADGVWKDVWLSKDAPAAARVGVLRAGFREPVWAVALWSEFCQMAYEKPTAMWKNMPTVMLAKCAESQALRRVFPQELSGIYSEEEMGQADNVEIIERPWSDEDYANAREAINDLGEVLLGMGVEESEQKVILDKPRSTIGDETIGFEKWADRLFAYSQRTLAKIKATPAVVVAE